MDKRFRSINARPFWIISLCLPLLMILSACATPATQAPTVAPTSAPVATSAPAATMAPTTAPSSSSTEATINVATDPTLGQVLVDGNGMTLYIFTKDGPNQSNCTGKCFGLWPALKTQGHPTLGAGVDASMIGTAKAADGSEMVTYNKMPLYLYSKDQKAGDTTGQGVGSVWFTVAPDGNPVGMNPPSSTATEAPAATVAPATTVTTTTSTTTEATINVSTDPTLGQILVDGNGMTLYIFTKDGPNQSNCSGNCFALWPPLSTMGNPTLGTGVDASLIGTTKATDGSEMVTYNKMPLYHYSKDQNPGDTNGQGVGSVWYAVSPDGKPVGMNP